MAITNFNSNNNNPVRLSLPKLMLGFKSYVLYLEVLSHQKNLKKILNPVSQILNSKKLSTFML